MSLIVTSWGSIRNGNRITNSTSKIKKRIVIKKKCKEKGLRDLFWGINPHSKGSVLSSSNKDFFLRKPAIVNTSPPNVKVRTKKEDNIIIRKLDKKD